MVFHIQVVSFGKYTQKISFRNVMNNTFHTQNKGLKNNKSIKITQNPHIFRYKLLEFQIFFLHLQRLLLRLYHIR